MNTNTYKTVKKILIQDNEIWYLAERFRNDVSIDAGAAIYEKEFDGTYNLAFFEPEGFPEFARPRLTGLTKGEARIAARDWSHKVAAAFDELHAAQKA